MTAAPDPLAFNEATTGRVAYVDCSGRIPEQYRASDRVVLLAEMASHEKDIVRIQITFDDLFRRMGQIPREQPLPAPVTRETAESYLRASRVLNDMGVLFWSRGYSGARNNFLLAMRYANAALAFAGNSAVEPKSRRTTRWPLWPSKKATAPERGGMVDAGFGVIERLLIGYNQVRYLIELGDNVRAALVLDDLFGPWIYFAGMPVAPEDHTDDVAFLTDALQYLDGYLSSVRT